MKMGLPWASHMLTYQKDSRKYGGITGNTEKGSNTCTPKKAGSKWMLRRGMIPAHGMPRSPALLSFERTCANLRHRAARSSHHQHPPVRTSGKHWKPNASSSSEQPSRLSPWVFHGATAKQLHGHGRLVFSLRKVIAEN